MRICALSTPLIKVDFSQWNAPSVNAPLATSGALMVAFVVVELLFTPEPVLAPFLLRQKVPVLIGISNFLVANCNFAVMYFFPMWFETVALTSASKAGMYSFALIKSMLTML